MKKTWSLVVGMFLAGASVAAESPEKPGGAILVYCAAGIKEPVAEIAALFEKETGTKVQLTYANSGQLLGQIETTRMGDLYIPGDVGFAAKAAEKKLTAGEPREFCYFVPVLYVRKGNPKAIADVADLVKPGLKLALAAESSAVGQLQVQIFTKNKLDMEALRRNTVTSPATVMDVALAVKLGTADAAIIWDALSDFAPDDAEAVRISPDKNVVSTVALCMLAGAKNPTAAKAFMEFLLSEKGKAVLKARKFTMEKPGKSQ